MNAIIQASKCYDMIGDFRRWKESFNHFGDANAPQTIADFIDEYMDIVMASGDTRGALKLAVTHYIKINRISDDFSHFSNWWQYLDADLKTIMDRNHAH